MEKSSNFDENFPFVAIWCFWMGQKRFNPLPAILSNGIGISDLVDFSFANINEFQHYEFFIGIWFRVLHRRLLITASIIHQTAPKGWILIKMIFHGCVSMEMISPRLSTLRPHRYDFFYEFFCFLYSSVLQTKFHFFWYSNCVKNKYQINVWLVFHFVWTIFFSNFRWKNRKTARKNHHTKL